METKLKTQNHHLLITLILILILNRAAIGSEQTTLPQMCADTLPPLGAIANGYTINVIKLCPKAEDIAISSMEHKPLYSGLWFSKKNKNQSLYTTTKNALRIFSGGVVSTARDNSTIGSLPLLSGKNGFYVEFEVSLSDNNKDHWPALWLLPVEHNNRQDDHFAGDPEKYERWMELDVDEGGFGPGFMGTVISWTGIWPNYQLVTNEHNKMSKIALDRSQPHIFAASYDPENGKVTWWLDNVLQMTAEAPSVPEIAKYHNYYLIISAQQHKEKIPYFLDLHGIRAFIRP